MQLGIFAKTFGRPTVEEVFAAVAKHRLRCVQFNFACAGLPALPDRVEPELADRIHKAAAQHRLEIAAVSGTFNMIHPDAKQRRDGLRKLGVVAGACARLGARTVTLCTGTRDPDHMWKRHPDNDSPAAWRDLLVSVTKALTIANKHDVTLGIEPETGNVVSSARQARRLLDEMKSPRLKIIMDAANLLPPGELGRMKEIMEDAFDLLGPDLVLAHAKDLRASGHAGTLALGKGVLDWDQYLARLQAAHFNGPLILHGFEERQVAASVKFLRSRLPSAKSG